MNELEQAYEEGVKLAFKLSPSLASGAVGAGVGALSSEDNRLLAALLGGSAGLAGGRVIKKLPAEFVPMAGSLGGIGGSALTKLLGNG